MGSSATQFSFNTQASPYSVRTAVPFQMYAIPYKIISMNCIQCVAFLHMSAACLLVSFHFISIQFCVGCAFVVVFVHLRRCVCGCVRRCSMCVSEIFATITLTNAGVSCRLSENGRKVFPTIRCHRHK